MRMEKLYRSFKTGEKAEYRDFYSVCDKDIGVAKNKGTILVIPTSMKIFMGRRFLFFEDRYLERGNILLSRQFVKECLSEKEYTTLYAMSEYAPFAHIPHDFSMDVDIAYLSFDTKAEAAKFKLSS